MGHLCQTILTFFVQNGVSHIGIFLFHCITKNLTVHPSTEFVFNWDKSEGNTYFLWIVGKIQRMMAKFVFYVAFEAKHLRS